MLRLIGAWPAFEGHYRDLVRLANALPETRYFFAPAISPAGVVVLGGDMACPGGECAPAASSGLDAAGVIGVGL